MKKIIIILNIISALAIVTQIVFIYLCALGKAHNTGGANNSKTSVVTYFYFTFFILLDIGITYSVILSHTLGGQLGLVYAAVPAVISIIIIVLFFLVIR
jgi:hypothetical protein